MAKRFLTIIISVLFVLSIAFSLKTESKAADFGSWKGAYRANYTFVAYVSYTLAGTGYTTPEGSQDFTSLPNYLVIYSGETYGVGDDGVFYKDGCPLHVGIFVLQGKMTKIY